MSFPADPKNPDLENDPEHEGVAVDDESPQTKRPPKYAVFLHNDDFTTMEFVIEVLERYFHKTHDEAMQVMLKVHHEGRGVAGIYGFDIAETKADQVTQLARSKGFPLLCTIEPLEDL